MFSRNRNHTSRNGPRIVDYTLDFRRTPTKFGTRMFSTFRKGAKWIQRVEPGTICRYRMLEGGRAEPAHLNKPLPKGVKVTGAGYLFVSQAMFCPFETVPEDYITNWEYADGLDFHEESERLMTYLSEYYGERPNDEMFTCLIVQKVTEP